MTKRIVRAALGAALTMMLAATPARAASILIEELPNEMVRFTWSGFDLTFGFNFGQFDGGAAGTVTFAEGDPGYRFFRGIWASSGPGPNGGNGLGQNCLGSNCYGVNFSEPGDPGISSARSRLR